MRRILYVGLMLTITASLLVAGCGGGNGGGPVGPPTEKAQIVYRLDPNRLTPEMREALKDQEITVLQGTTPEVTPIGSLSLTHTELVSEIDVGVTYYAALKAFNTIFWSKSITANEPGTVSFIISSQELRVVKISGRVVNKETGEPVAGLRLELMSPSGKMYSATTDENGEFVVYGLEGATSLDYSGEGYEPGSSLVSGSTRLEIEVSPKTLAKELATIIFHSDPAWEMEVWVGEDSLGMADSNGILQLTLEAGTYPLTYIAWGHKPYTETLSPSPGQTLDRPIPPLEKWDLTGRWENPQSGKQITASMKTYDERPIVRFEGGGIGWFWIKGNRLIYRSPSGTSWANGAILNDGKRVEYDAYSQYGTNHVIYDKVD